MSAFRCDDWRDASPERMAPLYAREIARWASLLEWDAASGFEQIEIGRRLGHANGRLAIGPGGVVAGWAFYIVKNRCLQIGGFVSSSEGCTEALLSAIFETEPGASATSTTFFAYSDAPALAGALRKRGQTVDRYFYLARDLTAVAVPYPLRDARRWSPADAVAATDLMERAYPVGDDARPFAPRGGQIEWLDYVIQLVAGRGCGDLMEEASVSLPLGPDRLSGLALVTRVAPITAHLVQLAIDPAMRRQGLGSALLLAACRAAHRCGCRRMTLIVSGKNAAARRMYEGAGFEPVFSFIAAGSRQPLRSTSVAGSGVAASRR